jgi:hypothetical protein
MVVDAQRENGGICKDDESTNETQGETSVLGRQRYICALLNKRYARIVVADILAIHAVISSPVV